MTSIPILNGDFEILFADETVGSNAVAGMKMVRRAAGATLTVYESIELYSAVAEHTDFFQAQSFENPILPVTPNAYTMENNYFMPRSSMEFLKGGAFDANWLVASGEGVYRKVYTAVTVAPATTDVGRQVTEATSNDTGTLLDFEVEPDGTTTLWIRPDGPGDTFALSTALTTTGDGGTMNVVGTGAATSGRTLVPSLQVIGAVPEATEVYLVQDRTKMTDWQGNFQWWQTDSTVSLGIVDILVRVINAGVTIADGDVEVFGRRYTSLYDNFRLNIIAGGRSALPLASAPDINNTTGYRTLTGSAGVSDFDVGNYIYVGGTFATATKTGVLTAVSGSTAAPVLEYYLTGDLTDFVNTDSIQEYDPIAAIDGDGSCTAGTPTANLGGPTDTASGEGGTVTVTLGTTTRDHDGDGVAEPYSIIIDAQSNVSIAKVYERIKYITRRGADEVDLFGVGVNMPGESYRGLDGLFEYDASTGTMTQGDDILTTTGGNTWTARLVAQNTTNSPTYITVMDQQTSLDSVLNDNVIEDEAGTEDVTVHAGGSLGLQSITSPKASPFGTFTGTQIFGARGVDYRNPSGADTQNYILTDDTGVLRNPPNTVAFTVTGTISGDRVLVARDTGSAGIIDKDQFGGLATPAGVFNGLADVVVRVAGSIDSEVPPAGYIRIVETGLQQEHKYWYDSRTTGALGEFSLRNITEGTGVTSASTTNLIDTTANFTTPQVEIGMLVRNITVGKTTHVWEVTAVNSATDLTVRQLYGPLDASQDWDIADDYTINALIGDHTAPTDYGSTDDLFDLILDLEVTGTSINNTFVKTLAVDFDVVVNVRNGKIILPFTQNQTVGDGGASVTVVRAPDTIAV